jgi:hypothetical protein
MKDGNISGRGLLTFSLVFCLISILTTAQPGLCSSTDEQENADNEELRLREDVEVKEVNEAISDEIAEAEAVKRNRYQEELGYVPTGKLLSDEEIAAFEKERAEKEQAVRARVNYEISSPTVAPEERKAPASQRRIVKAASAAGTVTGIVYYDGRGAALVGGEVVRENDVVLGAKIVRILPDYVEFEKHGRKWRQLVGKIPPASEWQEEGPSPRQSSSEPNLKAKPKPAAKPKTGKK